MFYTSAPVTAGNFHDRRAELAELTEAFESLASGTPTWIAIIGRRKIGKTSILLEAARRTSAKVDVVVADVFEMAPLTVELFRVLVLRALDAMLAEEAGASFERAARDPRAFRRLLDGSSSFAHLPAQLRTEVRELGEAPVEPDSVRRLLQLPEDLANALDRRLVVAIDEVQELATLVVGRKGFDPFPVMRAVWQRHQRVAYVISGSALSMLENLVTSCRSPFFQHFRIMRLGSFSRADAVDLLVGESPAGREIPPAIAARCAEVVGGNPFYLQLAGEALVAREPPYDERTLKEALQALVFSRTGRLGLYFQNEYQRLVGNSTTLAATLEALAGGALRLTEIARAIRATAPSAARYVERLGDAVTRRDDGAYLLADHLFGDWLRWRSPGGTVVPMTILGDEAERSVAEYLAGLGFDLVYQSRASRGAFDLLAIRGPTQLGLQVRRGDPPLRFSKREWARMGADAQRWDWAWAIASVDSSGAVRFLDPSGARVRREVRIGTDAAIENLLRWLDHRP